MAFGIYIHIPYCLSKCRYCDFYSAGHSGGVPDEYVQAVVRQLESESLSRPDTLYFGGGTPSLLSPEQLERMVRAVNPLPDAEVTVEANPETLSPALLEGFLRAGANRLSLGVQTAFDDSLRRLGRPHTAAQSREALHMARQAGFANISGDIMMALPYYSQAEFDATLELLEEGGVCHISAYLLKIEPGTAFGRNPPAGLPDEDETADLYLYAVEQLERHGFAQYEISNFARPGRRSRHNLLYWNCEEYRGIGPAAHSCMHGVRTAWPACTADFIAGQSAEAVTGECTGEDFVMLQLRLNDGLDLQVLKQKYGLELSAEKLRFAEQCVRGGLAVWKDGRLCLTPRGMLVQNAILCQLLDFD